MVTNTAKINRTPSGIATMSAGGGAYTNTYSATTILKPTPEGYVLKRAGFIKTAGHLACSTEQAIIPVEVGDIIVTLSGILPVSDKNPDAKITAHRITEITDQTATVEPIPITHREIPLSVIQGTESWHNREGKFFCLPPEQEG